ncbi:DUF4815 domain-containing protein [Salmonella enterica]|nr:DUF4815 domain-containing protein [Salmonella enterica]
MTTTIPALEASNNNGGYYNRSKVAEAKNYDKHVFIAGRILQSAEMNEIQDTGQRQLKAIADALFKDGDIVRDARCVVDENTGDATLEAGAVYCGGQVRGIPGRTFTIPMTGTVSIGVWLVTDVVTDTDDSSLLDPATGNRGFNEPGAYRLRVVPQWGIDSDNLANAEFFPVYYADDGLLRAKEPPPNLDSVTQAIARYDVDSNGSNYIVSGMTVTRLPDENGEQVYSVSSGRARVNGFGISFNAARRFTFAPDIDLKSVVTETSAAKAAFTADASKGDPVKVDGQQVQRAEVAYRPINDVTALTVLKAATLTVTRAQTGDYDQLTNSQGTIARVKSVKAGTTTYLENTHYTFDENTKRISWVELIANPAAVPGNFPARLASYEVEVEAWNIEPVLAYDDTGVYFAAGAVVPPLNPSAAKPTPLYPSVELDYNYRIPRIDRIVLTEEGTLNWIKGIASDVNPASPQVPSNLLSLCQVNQAWTSTDTDTTLSNDGVRMVSMSTLENMNSRLDTLTDLIAQLNLVSDINVREAGKKDGLFVDPFVSDDQRETDLQAYPQTLAITGGCLQLPIAATPLDPIPRAANPDEGITEELSCDYTEEVVLGNRARTSPMKVNPYMAFAPFPAKVTIVPQIDRWVDTKTAWTSAVTKNFTTTVYAPWTFGTIHGQTRVTNRTTDTEFVGSSTAQLEELRPITVKFTITGFRANEQLSKVLFDGIDVTP